MTWCHFLFLSRVGVAEPIFFFPLFSQFFQNHQNIVYLSNITFIFDRCHCSLAAETPAKYEYDAWSDLTFKKIKFSPPEKLMNRDLVPPPQI